MSTNYNDLQRAGKKIIGSIEDNLERRSEEKAQEFVDKFNRTRGLWGFLHIGIFVELLVVFGVFFGLKFNLSTPIAMLAGAIIGVIWWNAKFTKSNPFISSVLAFSISSGLLIAVK